MSVITRTAAIAALLLASACSGQPKVLEPDPTASETPSAAITPPPKPKAVDQDSEAGAATFANYWVSVSDYAASTGDTTELSRISSEECEPCQTFIELYRNTHRSGGSFSGGDQTFADVSVRRAGSGKMFVYAKVTAKDGTFKASAKAPPKSEKGGTDSVVYTVVRAGAGWKMGHQALEGAS